jgi:hypothetical protein
MAYFYDRIVPGGVMFFDDYASAHYPMARSAVDEFLANKREKLFHIGYGPPAENATKSFIIRSDGSWR